MKTYELSPANNQRSFYGKAKVYEYEDGTRELLSYSTLDMGQTPQGNYYSLWVTNDRNAKLSATTLKHIKAFSGMNKKQYLELPYMGAKELIA